MEGRAAAIGIDPASQREFFEVWSKHDILRQRTRAYRPGAVETDHDILPRRDLLRSDYYNGFMKPHDMHAYMRMTLSIEDECRKIISLRARSRSATTRPPTSSIAAASCRTSSAPRGSCSGSKNRTWC